jgi:hypothetical protein
MRGSIPSSGGESTETAIPFVNRLAAIDPVPIDGVIAITRSCLAMGRITTETRSNPPTLYGFVELVCDPLDSDALGAPCGEPSCSLQSLFSPEPVLSRAQTGRVAGIPPAGTLLDTS